VEGPGLFGMAMTCRGDGLTYYGRYPSTGDVVWTCAAPSGTVLQQLLPSD
jgi:hypothetical protein